MQTDRSVIDDSVLNDYLRFRDRDLGASSSFDNRRGSGSQDNIISVAQRIVSHKAALNNYQNQEFARDAFSPEVRRQLEFERSGSRSPVPRDFSRGRTSMSPIVRLVEEPAIIGAPYMASIHTGIVDNLTQNNQEMARFLSEQRAFEWGFGRN